MLSLDTIMKDTIWVGKFYNGGRVSGRYADLENMIDDFRDFDIACIENQPAHLREFYEGYFSQNKYYFINQYYHNVYIKEAC